jgi:uncharacterized protein (TIGR02147 family)
MEKPNPTDRPVVFEYRAIPDYVAAMVNWRRQTDPDFSVRTATRGMHRCSPSLVTRVIKGQRRLTLDRVDQFSGLMQLTPEERSALKRWVHSEQRTETAQTAPIAPRASKRKRGQDHLLSDWLNVYVKDACHLKGFKPDPHVLHRLLRGIASPARIERSLKFLFREGFLRRTLDGETVGDVPVVTTNDGLPSIKIKKFHRKALELAQRGIFLYPLSKRQESAVVLRVNQKHVPALKELLQQFYEQILGFAEEHSADQDELFQVTINLVPIGGISNV